MFEKISQQITNVPEWWKRDERFWRLERYDRLLSGTFYSHLPYAFYDEVEGTRGMERMVPMANRRPSTQYRIPTMVARMTARKLFAGRHVPRVKHPDTASQKFARRVCRRAKLYQMMMDIAVAGSVGSVAATFVVYGKGDNQRVKICYYNAKFCEPSFDTKGELSRLVVQYVTDRNALIALGDGHGISEQDPNQSFWFRREWTTDQEITYQPVPHSDWNPVDGWSAAADQTSWTEWEEQTTSHGLGFVPGHWFKNLAGGTGIDGCSTWGPAIPNSIDIDYTLSQIGRGVRYNAAPQLVVIGETLAVGAAAGGGNDADITRDPMTYIRLPAGFKNEDGDEYGRGDAKLLEMTGTGIEAGLKYVDKVRKDALEQITAARKDPEQMKGPMSGRAMEYLDDDWHDLVMELRTAYGEEGMLCLLRKMVAACAREAGTNIDYKVDGLMLRWPRLFQPTPTDLAQIMPAFQIAVNPFEMAQQAEPAVPGGENGGGQPAKPKMLPEGTEQFLTVAEVRQWLRDNMDLGTGDDDDDDDEFDDESFEGEPEPPNAPSPAPDGGGPDPEEDDHTGDEDDHVNAEIVVSAVRRVNAGAPT